MRNLRAEETARRACAKESCGHVVTVAFLKCLPSLKLSVTSYSLRRKFLLSFSRNHKKRSFTAGPRSIDVNKLPQVRLRFNLVSLLRGRDGQHMPKDKLVHIMASFGTRKSEHL